MLSFVARSCSYRRRCHPVPGFFDLPKDDHELAFVCPKRKRERREGKQSTLGRRGPFRDPLSSARFNSRLLGESFTDENLLPLFLILVYRVESSEPAATERGGPSTNRMEPFVLFGTGQRCPVPHLVVPSFVPPHRPYSSANSKKLPCQPSFPRSSHPHREQGKERRRMTLTCPRVAPSSSLHKTKPSTPCSSRVAKDKTYI